MPLCGIPVELLRAVFELVASSGSVSSFLLASKMLREVGMSHLAGCLRGQPVGRSVSLPEGFGRGLVVEQSSCR
jgi:hypothetical protein